MNFKMVPKFAMHNRELISNVSECSCYYCLKTFGSSEIKEWTDKNDDTALCPYCSVDAVIPVYSEEEKNPETLLNIHKYWF